MCELRRIRLGVRPVTGQDHRDNIASFIAKHVPAGNVEASGKENGNVANVDPVEQHRPEAVVVEVQGIVEQRLVSSMLQSVNFRQTLKNIIRGTLSSRRQASAATATAGRVQQQPPATPLLSAENGSHPSIDTLPNEENVHDTAAQPSQGDSATGSAPHALNTLDTSNNHAFSQRNPYQMEQGLWDSISQVQHEEMVYEISDLLHRRLVSTALSSEFRTVMELHVQEQISHTGANGEAVADFVRSIHQSQPHIPNDFHHLGIAQGTTDDGSDNISITGISTTSVPYTQTNLHLNHELQRLKAQVAEIKNMLRLSFDLQLDIQRSIRQEVAAAIATTSGAVASHPMRSAPVNDTHCIICLENTTDSVLYQCGHMCVCFVCGMNLMTQGNAKCPMCRAPIKDIIRAYKASSE